MYIMRFIKDEKYPRPFFRVQYEPVLPPILEADNEDEEVNDGDEVNKFAPT